MFYTVAVSGILAKSKWEELIEKFKEFVPTIIFAVIVFILGIFISKIIVTILGKGLNKSKLDKTAHGFLKSLVKITLYTLVTVISLTILNVPMTSIIAVIGAAGLAVGLALQNSLSNLAGGFIILFSKPFVVGNYIESNGVSGTVESISILYTKLLTPDNKAVYIPNGQISGSKIINFTQEKLRRLELIFSISYSNDYKLAVSLIKKILSVHPFVILEPEPFVRLSENAANSMNIVVRVWVESEKYWDLNYDLLEQVKKTFDENGIQIPYNQIDVHLDK